MAATSAPGFRKKYAKYLILLLIFSPSATERISLKPFYRNYRFYHSGDQSFPGSPITQTNSPSSRFNVNSAVHGSYMQHQSLRPHHLRNHGKQSLDPFNPSFDAVVMKKCKGRKNLLDDIGLLSLATATVASAYGLYTVIMNSMTSNNIGIISGFFSLVIWLPATLITLFNFSGNVPYLISNFINGLSFINTMYGFLGVIFGTADVLFSTVGESFGMISLLLSVIATFPDWLDSLIELLYRVGNRPRIEYYVENYGCSVPRIFTVGNQALYELTNRFLVERTNVKKTLPGEMR